MFTHNSYNRIIVICYVKQSTRHCSHIWSNFKDEKNSNSIDELLYKIRLLKIHPPGLDLILGIVDIGP